ncbi:MAG: AAA family ATPase [Deltaproteobacteria bacterium]|nr:AAA family ATPase [Deltaproteobacteria bacterium]
MAVQAVNDNLVLICGTSAGGKSASLRNIKKPDGVMYLNCESGKKLPFKSKFKEFKITDPYQVYEGFDAAELDPSIHTIVVDSLTFLMDMYESVHVLPSKDTMKGWQNYQQFFKSLMQNYVPKSTKNVIFTAHVLNIQNEAEMVLETKVPIKGALKNNGIEAYFSTIITARKLDIYKLKDYVNPLLTISEEEELLGYKYVYQTRLTKETVHHRIRSSMGMWAVKETFIDNDGQLLLDRLHKYYN